MIPALLSGCILVSEECGNGFSLSDGRCVPVEGSDSIVDSDSRVGAIESVSDAAVVTPDEDSTGVDQDMAAEVPTIWQDFEHILIVDRTEDGGARRTPALPGSDIDGITVSDGAGMSVGTGDAVVDERINDPFMASIQMDSRASLGTPDGRAVSLGTQGGFVKVSLGLSRPLRPGDTITIVEIDEVMGDGDRYEAFICRADAEFLTGCRVLGVAARGGTQFSL